MERFLDIVFDMIYYGMLAFVAVMFFLTGAVLLRFSESDNPTMYYGAIILGITWVAAGMLYVLYCVNNIIRKISKDR